MLTEEERETLAEPVYDAYRLGKFGAQEYLPMWHELDHQQPPNSVELDQVLAAVERIVTARVSAALREAAAALWEDLPQWATQMNAQPRRLVTRSFQAAEKSLRDRADQYDRTARTEGSE